MYRSNIIYIDTLQFNGVSCMESVMEEQTTDLNRYCYLGERKIMSDLISRKDALKPFCTAPDGTPIPEVDCDNFPVAFSVEFIKKHLLSLPSADAEWIPCSERLPEEGEKVLASTTNTVFTQVFKGTHGTSDSWWWNNNTIKTIYAWMPLPEPYREDGEA